MNTIHNDPRIAPFVAERVGGGGQFGSCATMGWEHEGRFAGVVFHDWQYYAKSIEISAVSEIPAFWGPKHLNEIMAYPFDQLGCRIVIARHSERNAVARRFWSRVGATEHIIPDLREDGVGDCFAVLHRDVWNKSKYKKEPCYE